MSQQEGQARHQSTQKANKYESNKCGQERGQNHTRPETQSSDENSTSEHKLTRKKQTTTANTQRHQRRGANKVQGHPGSRAKLRPAVSCAYQQQDDESPGASQIPYGLFEDQQPP
jgi:hypothetical protein